MISSAVFIVIPFALILFLCGSYLLRVYLYRYRAKIEHQRRQAMQHGSFPDAMEEAEGVVVVVTGDGAEAQGSALGEEDARDGGPLANPLAERHSRQDAHRLGGGATSGVSRYVGSAAALSPTQRSRANPHQRHHPSSLRTRGEGVSLWRTITGEAIPGFVLAGNTDEAVSHTVASQYPEAIPLFTNEHEAVAYQERLRERQREAREARQAARHEQRRRQRRANASSGSHRRSGLGGRVSHPSGLFLSLHSRGNASFANRSSHSQSYNTSLTARRSDEAADSWRRRSFGHPTLDAATEESETTAAAISFVSSSDSDYVSLSGSKHSWEERTGTEAMEADLLMDEEKKARRHRHHKYMHSLYIKPLKKDGTPAINDASLHYMQDNNRYGDISGSPRTPPMANHNIFSGLGAEGLTGSLNVDVPLVSFVYPSSRAVQDSRVNRLRQGYEADNEANEVEEHRQMRSPSPHGFHTSRSSSTESFFVENAAAAGIAWLVGAGHSLSSATPSLVNGEFRYPAALQSETGFLLGNGTESIPVSPHSTGNVYGDRGGPHDLTPHFNSSAPRLVQVIPGPNAIQGEQLCSVSLSAGRELVHRSGSLHHYHHPNRSTNSTVLRPPMGCGGVPPLEEDVHVGSVSQPQSTAGLQDEVGKQKSPGHDNQTNAAPGSTLNHHNRNSRNNHRSNGPMTNQNNSTSAGFTRIELLPTLSPEELQSPVGVGSSLSMSCATATGIVVQPALPGIRTPGPAGDSSAAPPPPLVSDLLPGGPPVHHHHTAHRNSSRSSSPCSPRVRAASPAGLAEAQPNSNMDMLSPNGKWTCFFQAKNSMNHSTKAEQADEKLSQHSNLKGSPISVVTPSAEKQRHSSGGGGGRFIHPAMLHLSRRSSRKDGEDDADPTTHNTSFPPLQTNHETLSTPRTQRPIPCPSQTSPLSNFASVRNLPYREAVTTAETSERSHHLSHPSPTPLPVALSAPPDDSRSLGLWKTNHPNNCSPHTSANHNSTSMVNHHFSSKNTSAALVAHGGVEGSLSANPSAPIGSGSASLPHHPNGGAISGDWMPSTAVSLARPENDRPTSAEASPTNTALVRSRRCSRSEARPTQFFLEPPRVTRPTAPLPSSESVVHDGCGTTTAGAVPHVVSPSSTPFAGYYSPSSEGTTSTRASTAIPASSPTLAYPTHPSSEVVPLILLQPRRFSSLTPSDTSVSSIGAPAPTPNANANCTPYDRRPSPPPSAAHAPPFRHRTTATTTTTPRAPSATIPAPSSFTTSTALHQKRQATVVVGKDSTTSAGPGMGPTPSTPLREGYQSAHQRRVVAVAGGPPPPQRAKEGNKCPESVSEHSSKPAEGLIRGPSQRVLSSRGVPAEKTTPVHPKPPS